MYFLRLAMLKPVVEQKAEEAWRDFEVTPRHDPQNKLEGLLLILRMKDCRGKSKTRG